RLLLLNLSYPLAKVDGFLFLPWLFYWEYNACRVLFSIVKLLRLSVQFHCSHIPIPKAVWPNWSKPSHIVYYAEIRSQIPVLQCVHSFVHPTFRPSETGSSPWWRRKKG